MLSIDGNSKIFPEQDSNIIAQTQDDDSKDNVIIIRSY